MDRSSLMGDKDGVVRSLPLGEMDGSSGWSRQQGGMYGLSGWSCQQGKMDGPVGMVPTICSVRQSGRCFVQSLFISRIFR